MFIPDFGFETLYKTKDPEQLERAEYYQPKIEMRFEGGKWVSLVSEKHGWYDAFAKKPVHHISTLSPEEGEPDHNAALERYKRQVLHRASEGFVHGFSYNVTSDNKVRYRLIDPHAP